MSKLTSAAACDTAISAIGQIDRQLLQIQSRLDEQVAALKAEAEAQAQPLETKRGELFAAVETWCARNRASLTEDGAKKSGKLPSGEVGWRLGQAKLEVDPARESKIIDELLATSKTRIFVATRHSLDKRALLKAADLVKKTRGLRILPAEESFWLKPVALELAGETAVAG